MIDDGMTILESSRLRHNDFGMMSACMAMTAYLLHSVKAAASDGVILQLI